MHRRRLVRGGALVILGGLAAGCSSDVSRFQDSILTGSSRAQPQVASIDQQPYPGDVDRITTGAVAQPSRGGGLLSRAGLVPRPAADVGALGAVQTASTEPTAQAHRAPQGNVTAGPALAPVARQSLDGTTTGTAQPAQHAQAMPRPDVGQARTGRQPDGGGWSAEGGSSITVRQGDTIHALARRYNVPEDALRRANGISANNALQVGQSLIIPTFAQPGGARTAAADQPTERQPNMPSEPNQAAVLPQQPKVKENEAGGTTSQTNTASADRAPPSGSTYTVVAGDTLSAISRRTGVSTEALKNANGLSNGLIQIGQTLVIPNGGGHAATTQTAAADAVVTGSTGRSERQEGSTVSAYTPPVSSAQTLEVAALDTGDQEAPDATGAGQMRWPARGRVISGFGAESGGKRNDGIDIAVPEGTSIRAAENGVVIYAGDGLRDFGNTVLVRHEDGLVTVYGHASRINVSRGDTVRRGQEIALSGMSGSAESPRLHFEVRKDSTPVDPMTFLE